MTDNGHAGGLTVLGVDPGSAVTGFGVVAHDGRDLVHRHHSQLRLSALPSLGEKLARLYDCTMELIDMYSPGVCAVEGIFHGRNVRSMVVLGQARGAVMVAAANRGLEIVEYPPATVKQAVVGYGRAAKEQVQRMVGMILGRLETVDEHAADALAVAICHHHQHRLTAIAGRIR
ncbi:MAG: crossover junction endodeoxyribonuclease RuvC [Deltaproteobacteria bacterium]|nr:crossover junction endodeoxyribonuclease RuvC [Candidatus Anaeroferrophillacea bacterium]